MSERSESSRRIASFVRGIAGLALLGAAAWLGCLAAKRVLPESVFEREVRFPAGSPLILGALDGGEILVAPTQRALREALFARENGLPLASRIELGTLRMVPGGTIAIAEEEDAGLLRVRFPENPWPHQAPDTVPLDGWKSVWVSESVALPGKKGIDLPHQPKE